MTQIQTNKTAKLYEVKISVWMTLEANSEEEALGRAAEVMEDSNLGDSEADVISVGDSDYSVIELEGV